MSWDEYSDMFDKAQENGQYKCYVFDMKDSKKGYDRVKLEIFITLFKNNLNKWVIHSTSNYPEIPCIVSGDIILLLTKRDSIAEEEVYTAFKLAKEMSDINKQFHFICGYYETDDWVKGDKEYYLGYCIQELEYRSKLKSDLL